MLGLAACAAAPSTQPDSASAVTDESSGPIPTSQLPAPEAFTGWTSDPSIVEAPRPQDVTPIAVACADTHLYATHPSSERKRYHEADDAHFDQFKLTADSPVCKIKSANNHCALADDFQYIVLSDTFEDGCGHMYRGFWAVSFLSMDENMGTLISRGRTVYAVPNAEFDGEMYDGQTYPVDKGDFLVITSLFDGDAAMIDQDRASAATTHHYDPATHIWEYVGPYR